MQTTWSHLKIKANSQILAPDAPSTDTHSDTCPFVGALAHRCAFRGTWNTHNMQSLSESFTQTPSATTTTAVATTHYHHHPKKK